MKHTVVLYCVLLLITLLQLVYGQCPVSGCSPNRCFCSEESISQPREPKLHWHKKTLVSKLSTKGCVANGGLAVCPYEKEASLVEKREEKGCIAISIKNGLHTWECSSLQGGMPLPLVDLTGQVIASDGHHLMAYTSTGSPKSKPIYLFPEEGELFDLIITDNNYFIMIYKCGFIAATDTNGIPWASVYLNDTYNSLKGTFVPLSTPAVLGHRMYLPTAFWPHNSSAHSDSSFTLRLYAIDILDVMVGRIKVAWYSTRVIMGYLPSLEGNFEDCTLTPPPSNDKSKNKWNNNNKLNDKWFNSATAPSTGHVTALNESLIYFGINYKSAQGEAGYDRFVTVGLVDKDTSFVEVFNDGGSYSVISSVSSLTYVEGKPFKNNKKQVHDLTNNFYLTSSIDTLHVDNPTTTMSVMNISDSALKGRFKLDDLLGTEMDNIIMTSDFMTLEYSLPTAPPFSLMYVIFGVSGTSKSNHNKVESYLIGLSISIEAKPSLLWKIATPDGCTPLGLLPALSPTDENKEVMIIVGTQCGVTGYIL